jgi:Transcriptional regulator containing PAS, AAA-type ATPase, and DNA-binding domains
MILSGGIYMLAEIVVTSPNKEVSQLVEKVRNELNVNVTVIETSFEAAVNSVMEALSQDSDRIKVIASGGATLELLRHALPSVHMVSIHPTEYDLVLSLDRARMYGKEVGLILAGSEDQRVIEKLSAVLGLKTRMYVYNNWQELEKQVDKARKNGIEVMLGVGERISTLVRQEGLKYIPVSAGENTIRNALAWAKNIIELIEITKIEEETRSRKELSGKGLIAKYYFDDIICGNSKMSSIIAKARKYSNTDCTVLIRGESGTGKELLAQSMHNEHRVRCKRPFIAVNCASLDDNLFKSELFGYTEGSFTGASKGGKPGLFELANGGTLFLDEIGKMKLEPQGNLLRVLQEKEVRRIGSDRVIPVDVRVIAASNEDLENLIRKGSFREDLYFRLNVLKIALLPLRERVEDITDQAIFFLRKYSYKYGKPICSLPPYVLQKLSKMNWPGNSRQLENFVERCVVLADSEEGIADIILELLEEEFSESFFALDCDNNFGKDQISVRISTLAEMNIEIVRRMRARAKLTNSELALMLGISRPTLSKMLNYN